MIKAEARQWVGMGMLLVGFLMVSEQFGFGMGWSQILDDIWATYWPVIIIALGNWFYSKGGKQVGYGLMLFGGGLIVLNVLEVSFWSVFWPMIVIGLGVHLLRRQSNS